MIFSALFSSFCISMIFFAVSLVFETLGLALFIMIVAFLICFLIILFLGIPMIIILEKINQLNLTWVLMSGFFIGFILPLIMIILGDGQNWREEIKSTIIPSFTGALASAIFYKTLQAKINKKP